VNIVEFKERAPPAKVYVSAQILVERESQVGRRCMYVQTHSIVGVSAG
jgi:hypothetical protein